jgi:hypothetical protein
MTSIGQFSLFQRKNQWVSVRYTDPWRRFAGSHKIEELFLPIAMILTIQTAGLKTYPESLVLPRNQLTLRHIFKNLVTKVFLFCKFSQTQTGGYNKIKEPPNTDHDPNVFAWFFKIKIRCKWDDNKSYNNYINSWK